MKAITYQAYGAPAEVLTFGETSAPTPGADDVLIRVHASSVNPADVFCVTGTPYLTRAMFGLRRPKRPTPGLDVAGRVEAVGANVATVAVGDDVFAECPKPGAFAEFAVVPADVVAPMPDGLGYDEAAAVPLAGCTALQAVRDKAKVQSGQRVLINGASGGVGSFAVQIAKARGATVTGVCSGRNIELVQSLGADAVIDYTTDDFTTGTESYDVIIDLIGNHSWSACRSALKSDGCLVLCAGTGGRWLGPLPRIVKTMAAAPFASQRAEALAAQSTRTDLIELGGMITAGDVRPLVSERFPLEDVAAALEAQRAGHRQGKTVVTI